MHRTTGDNFTLDSQGRRVFTAGPPPTTLDEGWANAVQEEIARAIEASGQTLASGPGSDTMEQLATAIQRAAAYDAIISSQETFNAIWERTGANAYKIIDGIGAVYFKAYSGGYNMSGPSSPLSDGDTWGKFETNDATFIMCDGGNYFQMGDTPSYWEISTSNTVVYNMDVRGIGSSAAAIEYSIRVGLGIKGTFLLFPKISYRYSSANHYAISAHAQDNLVIGGEVSYCDNSANNFYGIFNFSRTIGCTIHDLTLTSASDCYGFYVTGSLLGHTNCVVEDVTAAGNFTAFTASLLTSCRVTNIVAVGRVIGFAGSVISACNCNSLESSGGIAYGFYGCGQLTACYALNISAASNIAYGFYDCDNVSGCEAKTINYTGTSSSYSARGFSNCNQLSGCTADDINATGANGYAYGFHTCARMSACLANDVTGVTGSRAYGYYTCTHMDGSCEATAIDDFDFYTCSNEPFKDLHSDEKTQVDYAAAGNMFYFTAPKDGFIWGFVSLYSAGGEEVWIKEGGYATGRADTDVAIWLNSTYAKAEAYCIPVKSGRSYYFKKASSIGVSVTLRFMPFGTTT